MSTTATVKAVSAKSIVEVAIKVGLNPVVRKGYVKFYQAGKVAGACVQVYLNKDETESTQIDLVNVTSEFAIPHKNINKEGWYKSVQQQLDMTLEVKDILGNFYKVCVAVASHTPAAKTASATIAELLAKAKAPATTEAQPEVGVTVQDSDEVQVG
jgi:hypothetical protein